MYLPSWAHDGRFRCDMHDYVTTKQMPGARFIGRDRWNNASHQSTIAPFENTTSIALKTSRPGLEPLLLEHGLYVFDSYAASQSTRLCEEDDHSMATISPSHGSSATAASQRRIAHHDYNFAHEECLKLVLGSASAYAASSAAMSSRQRSSETAGLQ